MQLWRTNGREGGRTDGRTRKSESQQLPLKNLLSCDLGSDNTITICDMVTQEGALINSPYIFRAGLCDMTFNGFFLWFCYRVKRTKVWRGGKGRGWSKRNRGETSVFDFPACLRRPDWDWWSLKVLVGERAGHENSIFPSRKFQMTFPSSESKIFDGQNTKGFAEWWIRSKWPPHYLSSSPLTSALILFIS